MAENILLRRLLARPSYLLGLALLVVGYSTMTYFVTYDHLSITPQISAAHPEEQHSDSSSSSGLAVGPDDVGRASNATLGFEKVFVIGLPERPDKRDAMSLAAVLTGIQLEWKDGAKGEDVIKKALPISGPDHVELNSGEIGCWRSHMTVLRTIVEENIASALILEDDADWDMRIKPQLVGLANGTRTLLELAGRDAAYAAAANSADHGPIPISAGNGASITNTTIPHSPYGDTWDLLWLGECQSEFPDRLPGHEVNPRPGSAGSARYTYHRMARDGTVPRNPVSMFSGDPEIGPNERWVYFSGRTLCTAAYAVSQAGARKLLVDMSGGTRAELNVGVDERMSRLCRDHSPWHDLEEDEEGEEGGRGGRGEGDPTREQGFGAKLRCLSVWPPLISQHWARGLKIAHSDIGHPDYRPQEDELASDGSSPHMVFSARLNLENLVYGRELERQHWNGEA